MPFRIDCPHCGKGMRVPTKLAGKASKCPCCEGAVLFPKIAVAIDPSKESAPSLDATSPVSVTATKPSPVIVSSPRSLSRRRSSPFFSLLAMLTLSISGTYAGYLVLDRLEVLNKPLPATKEMLPVPKRSPPAFVPQQPAPAVPPVQPAAASPAPRVAKPFPVLPAVELPKYIQLPDNADTQTKTLLHLPDHHSLSFTSIDPRLTLNKSTLRWSTEDRPGSPVARLAIRDGKLAFRWLPEPPKEAILAVHNSIVRVQSPRGDSAIAMRSPIAVEPIRIDLKKMVTRIDFKFPNMPPSSEVFLAFTVEPNFPKFLSSGALPEKMRVRDECILRYSGAAGVGTKIMYASRKQGLFVDLRTRYRLPSGDEAPLTFSRCRKKRKVIESLLDSAARLAKPAINRELAALKEIIAFAPVLEDAGALSLRFFTIIDAVEVDLGRLETMEMKLPQKAMSSQVASGPIVKQRAVPLLRPASSPVRSGWGNDFKLIRVHAESTAVIKGRLRYYWHVEIENSKSQHLAVDIFVKLMDAEENVLCVSDTLKTSLVPNETKFSSSKLPVSRTR